MNEVLSLANTGDKAAILFHLYSDAWMKMVVLQALMRQTKEHHLQILIWIYPRQVTLEPKEGQSIVLQVRRTVNMPDGEYRSHIYFRSENDYAPI
jgi:hypothetical protein